MRKTIRASIFRLLFTCSEILFLSAAKAQLMGFLPKKKLLSTRFQRCTQISQDSLSISKWTLEFCYFVFSKRKM